MTKYKVIMVSGSVSRTMYKFNTMEEAEECCDFYGWEVAPDGDGGFVWDLDIEEEEEE